MHCCFYFSCSVVHSFLTIMLLLCCRFVFLYATTQDMNDLLLCFVVPILYFALYSSLIKHNLNYFFDAFITLILDLHVLQEKKLHRSGELCSCVKYKTELSLCGKKTNNTFVFHTTKKMAHVQCPILKDLLSPTTRKYFSTLMY